jgi:23S rRNA (uracil1939-C5)-methyltransferase
VAETISSPQEWRYRNKVQVPFGKSGRYVVAGFYAPGSHDIVEFDDCPIQPTFSVDIVRYVKEEANRLRWPPYDEDTNSGWIRHLLVRTNEKGEALVVFVTKTPRFYGKDLFVQNLRRRFPKVIGVHQNVQPGRTNVILGDQWISLWGQTRIEEELLGLKLRYAAGSFFQVNRGAAEKLYAKAIDELNATKGDVVLDLYCGVGAMALLAAKRAKHAMGVEPVPSAIADARENAARNQINNIEFLQVDSERFLTQRSRQIEMLMHANPLVIVDPPRSGCTPDVLNGLFKLRPRRIVYVSCHPATLARDLKFLSSSYTLETVTPVDLFPQTSHIETVVRLERRDCV